MAPNLSRGTTSAVGVEIAKWMVRKKKGSSSAGWGCCRLFEWTVTDNCQRTVWPQLVTALSVLAPTEFVALRSSRLHHLPPVQNLPHTLAHPTASMMAAGQQNSPAANPTHRPQARRSQRVHSCTARLSARTPHIHTHPTNPGGGDISHLVIWSPQ